MTGEAGWQLVPKEPTEAMIEAATATPGVRAVELAMQFHRCRGLSFDDGAFDDGPPLQQAYRAMLAASPSPASAKPEGGEL